MALAYLVTLAAALALRDADTISWLVHGAPDAPRLSMAGWWVVAGQQPALLVSACFAGSGGIWSGRCCCAIIARLELKMVVTHPDGLGGLAFIGQYPNAFAAFVLAMSAVLAAAIANAFQHDALELTAYGYMMTAWLVIVLGLFGIPLLAFSRPLARLKRQALLAATAAATRHFRAAERSTLGANLAAPEGDDTTPGGRYSEPQRHLRGSQEAANAAVQPGSAGPGRRRGLAAAGAGRLDPPALRRAVEDRQEAAAAMSPPMGRARALGSLASTRQSCRNEPED